MEEDSTSYEFVPHRHQDGEDTMEDAEDIEQALQKRTRGKSRVYTALCSFSNFEMADQILKGIFDGHKWRKGNLNQGDKRFYNCYTLGKKSKCIKKMYLFMHSDSQYCTVYMSDDPHNHEESANNADLNRLKANVKDKIIQIYENETKQTSEIIEKLNQHGLKATSTQIYNLLQRYKTANYGERNMTLNQLKEYCTEHEEIPEDIDQVYIADKFFEAGFTEANEVRVFLTTKRLIQLALHTKHLCIDATYKLLWQGFPTSYWNN